MSDDIMTSVMQGFQMAHTLENDRRMNEVAQQQAMLHQMQMAKMAQYIMQAQNVQRQRADFAQMLQPQTMPSTFKPAPITDPNGLTTNQPQELVLGQTKQSPELESALSQYPEKLRPMAAMALRYAAKTGDHSLLDKLTKLPAEKPLMTLENILADKVKSGEMSLPEAIAAKKERDTDTVPKTDFQSYRAGKIAQGWDEDKIAETWKKYQKDLAVAGRTPRQEPDYEARDLSKEQKRNLIAERILKMRYGTLPQVNGITGETIFPQNPNTGKPFTQKEWAIASDSAYTEAENRGRKGKPQKTAVRKSDPLGLFK
jgi:hypothetical protein